ncbi:hypothetical protein QEZ54_20560 [Catellatospora sp. KI3]|uniref:hypothetical protein n=1 Tax=Catellatospora sp. KI3 TaxID=3041620 RepID=UPI002482F878|nr:hypothetical protein [Catellatospora sp. KI3]MDI1463377.1 hypothetical protein [Catellatospora sp. KI3]
MNPADLFVQKQDSSWAMNGEPWSVPHAFDTDLVEHLRQASADGVSDVDAAYALAQLGQQELTAYGTDGGERLSNDEMSLLLRSLRSVLRRLGIQFDPPFRDFQGFRGYWSANNMSGGGGWGARRGYVNALFTPVLSSLEVLEDASVRSAQLVGVDGEVKNIIFASTGPKPDIVFRDALSNVIEIVANGEFCLFYNRPLTDVGLDWGTLTSWWRTEHASTDATDEQVKTSLYRRLRESLGDNKPELLLFDSYYRRFRGRQAATQPALLPQVYLHYDPARQNSRVPENRPLYRQRLDFLLLLPGGVRIVLEVDGKQHYAVGDVASPKNYSEMMAEDRALRLAGYEIYRFGGYELVAPEAHIMLGQFFDSLATRHQLP